MKKILVVGSINKDITLHMRNLPLPGETVIANDLKSSLGGKGCNQAVAAARMGGEVSFIGAVDKVSDDIIAALDEDKINTKGIAKLDVNTGTAYISIDESAENNIIVYPGANFAFDKELLLSNEDLFIESDYCLMQMEVPLPIIYETIELCKKHNVQVIINPAPFNQDFDEAILKDVDYYVPNMLEFISTVKGDLTQEYPLTWFEEAGLEFAKKHGLTLVITLGSQGAMLIENDTVTLVPAVKTKAVDTTAAGDSFIGGFLASLSKGASVVDSLAFGAKVASITISRHGATSAIPSLAEVK